MEKYNINVLLADDDEDDRFFFEEALLQIDKEIKLEFAYDGEELTKKLKGRNKDLPNFVFLDINMPLKNGFECLKEIKAEPSLNKIPVIMYSTSRDKRQIELAYNTGADLYLCKPDSIGDLQSFLKEIISMDWDKSQRFHINDFAYRC